MMEPAHTIIAKCGGASTVARWLNVDASRPLRWTYPKERGGTGGFIPAKHQTALLEMAQANRIDLSPADFFSAKKHDEVPA